MLQKMKKNIVAPVDEEPTASDSITRINVIGKRDSMFISMIHHVV